MNEAVLLTLILTLLPGQRPDVGMDIAREALIKAGCADVRLVVEPGAVRRAYEVRARCAKLKDVP